MPLPLLGPVGNSKEPTRATVTAAALGVALAGYAVRIAKAAGLDCTSGLMQGCNLCSRGGENVRFNLHLGQGLVGNGRGRSGGNLRQHRASEDQFATTSNMLELMRRRELRRLHVWPHHFGAGTALPSTVREWVSGNGCNQRDVMTSVAMAQDRQPVGSARTHADQQKDADEHRWPTLQERYSSVSGAELRE